MKSFFKKYSLRLSKLKSNHKVKKNTIKIEALEDLQDVRANNVIASIRAHEKTGYYISNVVSNNDRVKLLAFFESKLQSEDQTKGLLTTYPDSFKTFSFNGQPISDSYFKEPFTVAKEMLDETGIDVNLLIQEILQKLNSGKKVSSKPANASGDVFHSFQFRSLSKHQKNIFIHTENMTTRHIAKMNNSLGNYKLRLNDFSYFICLQDTKGGELELFDYPWREGQYADLSEPMNPKIIDPIYGPIECNNDGINKTRISVKAGDMIVFNGGTTWHMVNKVLGNRERITLGGFLESQDNGEVYVWA